MHVLKFILFFFLFSTAEIFAQELSEIDHLSGLYTGENAREALLANLVKQIEVLEKSNKNKHGKSKIQVDITFFNRMENQTIDEILLTLNEDLERLYKGRVTIVHSNKSDPYEEKKVDDFKGVVDKIIEKVRQIKTDILNSNIEKLEAQLRTNRLDLLLIKLHGIKNIVDTEPGKIGEYLEGINETERILDDFSKPDTELRLILENNNFIPELTSVNLFARAYINVMKTFGYSVAKPSKNAVITGWSKTGLSVLLQGSIYANQFLGFDFFGTLPFENTPFIAGAGEQTIYLTVLGGYTLVQEWFFGPRIGIFLNILNNVRNNFTDKNGKPLSIKIAGANVEYTSIIYNFFQGIVLAGIPKELTHRINPSMEGFFSSNFLLSLIGVNLYNTAISALLGVELKTGLVEKGWLKSKNADAFMNVLDLTTTVKTPFLIIGQYEVYWTLFAVFDVVGKGGFYLAGKYLPPFQIIKDKANVFLNPLSERAEIINREVEFIMEAIRAKYNEILQNTTQYLSHLKKTNNEIIDINKSLESTLDSEQKIELDLVFEELAKTKNFYLDYLENNKDLTVKEFENQPPDQRGKELIQSLSETANKVSNFFEKAPFEELSAENQHEVLFLLKIIEPIYKTLFTKPKDKFENHYDILFKDKSFALYYPKFDSKEFSRAKGKDARPRFK